MIIAADMKAHLAIEYVQEALCGGLTELACTLEFGGVLCERGRKGRADVDDGGCGFHPRQGGPHESVGSEQQMISLMSAACVAEIMHDEPSFEIRVSWQDDSTNRGRILWPWRRPRPARILWDCG